MYFLDFTYGNKNFLGIKFKLDGEIYPLKSFGKKYEEFKDINSIVKNFTDEDIDYIKNYNLTNIKGINESDVKINPPIKYPKRNIICLGKNYKDHIEEVKGLSGGDDEIPKFPIYFMKMADPAIGHLDKIPMHKDITNKIDYEVELAVVIGKDGINIDKKNAKEYIFGYTIINDISARNIQRKHIQWFRGKSLEGFCPMGPYIAYKETIEYPPKLDIKCFVNDELRQNSNTKNFIFDLDYVISDLSKGMKLRKGDIIITGTPSGVGLGFKPFKFLNSKDKITSYIENIGTLINYME